MEILNQLGIDKEEYESATGEVGKEFTPLDAGVYKATVKSILVYTNSFGDKSMRYTVNIDSENVEISFRKDIGATLKDKKPNGGYANRFKQFLYATNTDESSCSVKEKAEKINSFGKEIEADAILGMNDKKILAEVLLMNDTTKEEGAPFKHMNCLSGVLALDGTDASGENKAEAFSEKAKKNPVTDYKGYVKQGSSSTKGSVDKNAAKEAEEAGF